MADKPSEERNLIDKSRGLVNPFYTPGRVIEGKVWPEGNTSLCWVCRYCEVPSWIDLVWVSIGPWLSSLARNPTFPFP